MNLEFDHIRGFASSWQVWFDNALGRWRWSASVNGNGEGGSEATRTDAEMCARLAVERFKSEQR